MIVADASPAKDQDQETFDLFAQTVPATIFVDSVGQELILGDSVRRIRISIVTGTLLEGPVSLSYRLSGTLGLSPQLLALRRFAALSRRGSLPATLFPTETRLARFADVIQTLDALAGDSTHRGVAIALFGPKLVEAEWDGRSDFLRSRVRRLIATARQLADGGYRNLLRTAL